MAIAQTTVVVTESAQSFTFLVSPPAWLCVVVGVVILSIPPLILWVAARRDARRDAHR